VFEMKDISAQRPQSEGGRSRTRGDADSLPRDKIEKVKRPGPHRSRIYHKSERPLSLNSINYKNNLASIPIVVHAYIKRLGIRKDINPQMSPVRDMTP